jgi:protein-tyrosine phosphatase
VGYVDLHSHVLPSLDDGAPDAAVSLAMLRGLHAIGFEVVYATPHQRAGFFLPSHAEIDAAYASTRVALKASNLELELHLGAENMWDGVFYERFASDTIPSYRNGPALLVEFPREELPVAVFDRLFELRRRGRLPVIAHPERYHALWSNPDLITRLAETSALVVDLGAIAGYHGRKEAKLARELVKRRIAHAAASDVHTLDDVRVAAEGIACIRAKAGEEAVRTLLSEGPRLILAGEHPEA